MNHMQAHVVALALLHKVEIQWRNHNSGTGWRKERKIAIPRVKSEVTYALALHELGHVLGEQSGRRMMREVQAWQWAKRISPVWTKAMNAKCRACPDSYVRWAQRRTRNSSKQFNDADAMRVMVTEFPLRQVAR